jgi:hypothetical protein
VIGRDDDAEATKWTGELSVEPDTGELIVTPANEDAANNRTTIKYRIGFCTAVFLRGRDNVLIFLKDEEEVTG